MRTFRVREVPITLSELREHLPRHLKRSHQKDEVFITPDSSKFHRRHDTVRRVVEGTFSLQHRWAEKRGISLDLQLTTARAEKMFDKIFHMKFLPPGRGLWAMGTEFTDGEEPLYAALNNCAFVSTESMHEPNVSRSKPFTFLMDTSLLGVGVGFDVKGGMSRGELNLPLRTGLPDRVLIHAPLVSEEAHRIKASREGWVESVRIILDSYLHGESCPQFDFGGIQEEGSPIKVRKGMVLTEGCPCVHHVCVL